jgi:photosystem II stability/assembly factor-like uncharacterized protein
MIHMYIGTDKGVVTARSRDQHSWEIVGHGLKNWPVPAVAVSPGSPNKIFAGTRGDGVWMSEDFGKSWKKPSYGRRGPGKVRSLTVDPHDARRLYAGGEPIDIHVSENEGKDWDRLDSLRDIPFIAEVSYPVASVEPHVRDVTVDPTDPNIVYAALQLGYIAKSTDAGKTWKILNNNIDCDVHTIEVDPSNPRRICIATGGHDARYGTAPGRALYLSENAGDSWVPVAMNFTQEYAVPLVLDTRSPNLLYSAVANGQPGQWRRDSGAESALIRSSDGGKTWKRLEPGVDGEDFPAVIAVDDAVPGHVYVGYRKGDFYVSDDHGDSWAAIGLNVSGPSSVALVHD